MRYQLSLYFSTAYSLLLSPRDCCVLRHRAHVNGALTTRLVAKGFAPLEDAKRGAEALNTIDGGF